MLPGVGVGVFQVQHHSGRSGVQHLYDQLCVVSWDRSSDSVDQSTFGSSICHACIVETEGGKKFGCLPPCASCSARFSSRHQRALAQCKRRVQWRKKFQKASRQVA